MTYIQTYWSFAKKRPVTHQFLFSDCIRNCDVMIVEYKASDGWTKAPMFGNLGLFNFNARSASRESMRTTVDWQLRILSVLHTFRRRQWCLQSPNLKQRHVYLSNKLVTKWLQHILCIGLWKTKVSILQSGVNCARIGCVCDVKRAINCSVVASSILIVSCNELKVRFSCWKWHVHWSVEWTSSNKLPHFDTQPIAPADKA